MKFLVVDDSRIMRGIIKNLLGNWLNIKESDIEEAQDGEAAMQIIKSEKIDLLLLDWNMPRLNGIELVKMLRAEDAYKDLPIIMVTSEGARYNVIEAINAGVTDYVVKPVAEKLLRDKIKKLLNI